MANALLTSEDVTAVLLRPLSPVEAGSIDWYCAQASAKLRTRLRSIDARIEKFNVDPSDKDGIDPIVVAGVLADIICRKLGNPRGAQSVSDSGGGFAHSESYGAAAGGSNALVITDADIAQLEARRQTVRTLRLGSTLPRRHRFNGFGGCVCGDDDCPWTAPTTIATPTPPAVL